MKNIILIAPPAAGKGTLSNLLVNNLGYVSLSTGDMLREKAQVDKELSEKMKTGMLIDDETVFSALELKLNNLNDKPYILDGFPRTLNQAKMYDELLNKMGKDLGVVVYLNVDKDALLERVTTRLVCPKCKKSYSTVYQEMMPKNSGVCDECGVELIQREDDKEEVFIQRYNEYLEKTAPLINYYKEKGILYDFKSTDTVMTYESVIKIVK